jgi:mycoredoxin
MAEIKMYTAGWCPDCRMAKIFLDRRGVDYDEIQLETTPGAAEFVKAANGGKRKVPTFDAGGEVFHCSPYQQRLLK